MDSRVKPDYDNYMHILVIDDDRRLRELLGKFLRNEGYDVETAEDAAAAKEKIKAGNFDILVMDRMMPGQDGVSLSREIRETSAVPILMLTAMGETKDRIDGLESGIDDYLVKPFEPRELVLRIENILRRTSKKTDAVRFGDFVFHMERGDLYKAEEFIALTSTELKMLEIFVRNLDKPVRRDELSKLLNGISERSIDVSVTRLRRKIEDNPKKPYYLQTAWGSGYVLRSRLAET